MAPCLFLQIHLKWQQVPVAALFLLQIISPVNHYIKGILWAEKEMQGGEAVIC
jgi:hypothetical protein